MKKTIVLSLLFYCGLLHSNVSDDFLQAVIAGKVELAEKLLSKGADINVTYTSEKAGMSYGETGLIMAATNGDVKMVRMLLSKGADPNKTNGGYSALGYAAGSGFVEVVKLLIKKGANVNQTNGDGTTPIASASADGRVEVVKILLNAGADPAIQNLKNENAFDYAKTDEIKKLLSSGKAKK